MDLKDAYVASMLGQKDLPAASKGETVAAALLRADSLWANGDSEGVIQIVSEQEKRPEWNDAYDTEWFGAYADGLRALAEGNLDAAYSAYTRAITARKKRAAKQKVKSVPEASKANNEAEDDLDRASADTAEPIVDIFAAERAVNVGFWLACSGKNNMQ
jgi:hypothetical protein